MAVVACYQPSVGVGNVGQLAVDLLVNTHHAKVSLLLVPFLSRSFGCYNLTLCLHQCHLKQSKGATGMHKIGHFHSVHAAPVAGNDVSMVKGKPSGSLTVNGEGERQPHHNSTLLMS